MLGRDHALSGLVTGLAVGALLHEPAAPLGMLAALTAAYALAPDLDSCGSTEARTCGFLTEALAWCVEKVSGGHRHGTHSLLGVAAFTGVAWLACTFRADLPGRAALAVILAVGLAAASDALHLGHAGHLAAIGGAAAICWTGYGLALIPLAAALGTSDHLLGDALTRNGVPLLWPVTMREFHLSPRPLRFTTGRTAERFVVSPLLLALLCFLLWRDSAIIR